MVKGFQQTIMIIILVIFVTGLPLAVQPGAGFQSIEFHPSNVWKGMMAYIEDFPEAPLGTYHVENSVGDFSQERSVAKDILPYALHSFALIFFSLLIAVIVSLLFGIILTRFWIAKVFRSIMDILSVIPDFVMIMLSVFLLSKFINGPGPVS
ncbi:MAG TPA: hypothetical protein VF199_10950 [Bacillales bacterium]